MKMSYKIVASATTLLSWSLVLGACSGDGSQQVARFLVTVNNDATVSVFRTTAGDTPLRAHTTMPSELTTLSEIVTAPDGRTVYVIGSDSSSRGVVQVVAMDERSGRLAVQGSTRVPNGASSALLGPGGRHLYVASASQNGLAQLEVVPGGLREIGPNLAGDPRTHLALHPSGRLLFAVGRDTRVIEAFGRDPASGALSAGPSITVDDPPTGLAFNPEGTVAYVTIDRDDNNLYLYDVSPQTGALTFRGRATAGSQPVDIVVDRTGSFAYVAGSNSNDVTVLSIAPVTGDLKHVQSASAGRQPRRLAFDPLGTTLYTADFSSASVTVFAIDPLTGRLGPSRQVRGSVAIKSLAVVAGTDYLRETSRYLLAPGSAGVHRYNISAGDGTLSTERTHAVDGGAVHAVVDPVTGYAFAVTGDNVILGYPFTTEASGRDKSTFVDSDASLGRLALEPSGRFLFALDARTVSGVSGRIYSFRILGGGALEPGGTANTGQNPENLVVHPAGRHLYSIDSFGDTITLFEISPSDGRLSQKQIFTPGRTGQNAGRPLSMAFHPNGRYAYVTLQDDREIVRYHLNDSNGFLESPERLSTANVNGDGRPRYIAVHPSGRYAAVSFWGDTVATFEIRQQVAAGAGAPFSLTLQNAVTVAAQPSHVAIDPAGEFAYVTVKGGTARLVASPSGPVGDPQPVMTEAADSSFSRAVSLVTELH